MEFKLKLAWISNYNQKLVPMVESIVFQFIFEFYRYPHDIQQMLNMFKYRLKLLYHSLFSQNTIHKPLWVRTTPIWAVVCKFGILILLILCIEPFCDTTWLFFYWPFHHWNITMIHFLLWIKMITFIHYVSLSSSGWISSIICQNNTCSTYHCFVRWLIGPCEGWMWF